jgi:hypothetical protein
MVFFGCALLGLVGAILYSAASARVEVTKSATEALSHHISPATQAVVIKLAGLFSLDAFGGGFLTDALVAYWFFRRFGVAEERLGILFFAMHLLNAASHLGAAWLARRIGLVNTMVFTHLPSSLFLVAAAFAPSLKVAVVLFLCREALVEMDVPTRQGGGSGSAERAHLCQRHRESRAQYFLGCRFVRCRLPNAERGFFGAFSARRRQDQLRPALVSCLSKP